MSELDTKASNLFGIASAITGFLLGTLNFGLESIRSLPPWHVDIYLLGTFSLVLAIVFCLFAIRVRNWTMAPSTKKLIEKYKNQKAETIYARVGGGLAKTEEGFIARNNSKAKNIRIAWYFTIAGLCLVFLYAVLLFVAY